MIYRYLIPLWILGANGCASVQSAQLAIGSAQAGVQAAKNVIGGELGQDVSNAFETAEKSLSIGQALVTEWQRTYERPGKWHKWINYTLWALKQVLLAINATGVEVPAWVFTGLTAASVLLGSLL